MVEQRCNNNPYMIQCHTLEREVTLVIWLLNKPYVYLISCFRNRKKLYINNSINAAKISNVSLQDAIVATNFNQDLQCSLPSAAFKCSMTFLILFIASSMFSSSPDSEFIFKHLAVESHSMNTWHSDLISFKVGNPGPPRSAAGFLSNNRFHE